MDLTPEEWNALETDYEQRVRSIIIPPDPTTMDVKNLISQIDAVYTEIRVTHSRIRSAYENIKTAISIAKSSLFNDLFDEGRNNDERDALVMEALSRVSYEDTDQTLIEAKKELRRRKMFMDDIVKSLDAKRDMLITDSNILKIEASI
jgi:hypothetical protein